MFIPFSAPITAPITAPGTAPGTALGSSPTRWLLVLHGIYGRGGNWRVFARKICSRYPDWGVLLVDLRMHGKSMSAPGPHTLAACADDVLALIDQQNELGVHIDVVVGHSFGGKVALEMKRRRPATKHHTWLIDSSPAARTVSFDSDDNSVVSVLRMLQVLPKIFTTRDEFIGTVVEHGFSKSLAMWLAMNLEPVDGGYRNTLDPEAMRALLSDYFQQDLWDVLEAGDSPIHLAIASSGSSLSEDDQDRLQVMHLQGAVDVHHVTGSHWLHVDALDAIVDLVADRLPRSFLFAE